MSLFGWEEQQQVQQLQAALKSWQVGFDSLKPRYDMLVIENKMLQSRIEEGYKSNNKTHQDNQRFQDLNKNRKV
jgi:hypothetical protein